MGAEGSTPKAGARLQIIGAGLPRTGTSSFAKALSILLDGPTYHGGTQLCVSGDETHVKTQIAMLQRTPIKTPADKAFVLKCLKDLSEGYVATCDSAMCHFAPELLELYPDAMVVCTVRDPDAWARSMGQLASNATQNMLAVMLFWVPCLRYFPKWVDVLVEGRWSELYIRKGEPLEYTRVTFDRHIEWLQQNVPKERLIFYDVKDGWAPLCKLLNVPIPNIEFPNMNDGEAMDKFAKDQIAKGLTRWAVVSIASAITIYTTMWMYGKHWLVPGELTGAKLN